MGPACAKRAAASSPRASARAATCARSARSSRGPRWPPPRSSLRSSARGELGLCRDTPAVLAGFDQNSASASGQNVVTETIAIATRNASVRKAISTPVAGAPSLPAGRRPYARCRGRRDGYTTTCLTLRPCAEQALRQQRRLQEQHRAARRSPGTQRLQGHAHTTMDAKTLAVGAAAAAAARRRTTTRRARTRG